LFNENNVSEFNTNKILNSLEWEIFRKLQVININESVRFFKTNQVLRNSKSTKPLLDLTKFNVMKEFRHYSSLGLLNKSTVLTNKPSSFILESKTNSLFFNKSVTNSFINNTGNPLYTYYLNIGLDKYNRKSVKSFPKTNRLL
jgi:hypothetical protein